MTLSQLLDKHQPTSIGGVEWSTRAENVLNALGITSLAQLAAADIKALTEAKNAGPLTVREFLRVLLDNHITPAWLKKLRLPHNPITEREAAKLDMVLVSGPYATSERWMLEVAIAHLEPIPWAVVSTEQGYSLYRDRNGVKEVQPEE